MKILSVPQIQALDQHTIHQEDISSSALMERAAQAFVRQFQSLYSADFDVYIFCGPGNNGGDGLATARLLAAEKYSVKVFSLETSSDKSPDFKQNQEALPASTPLITLSSSDDFPALTKKSVIIDALFGSGLSRPLEGLGQELVSWLNEQSAKRVAVDIPSGLFADSATSGEAIFRADHTISFQLPKLAFLLPQNAPYVGAWQVVDIGLSEDFIEESSTTYYLTERDEVKQILKKRGKYDHKGTFGHLLLVVGSYGKIGAAILACKAALRSGAGLVSVHTPQKGYIPLQTAAPEAMVLTDYSPLHIIQVPTLEDDKYQAVGIGCGIGQEPATREVLGSILYQYDKPMVIDADALNLIGQDEYFLASIPEGSILTPHPKELERLIGKTENDFHRLEVLLTFAQSYKIIVVLKGAHTTIATPEGKIYFNNTGNPGMATGGSGDVLTGLLTGLLSQGYEPLDAALLGVHLHGLAADLALRKQSQESLIATDIIKHFGMAFRELSSE